MKNKEKLANLPSVDEYLKSSYGQKWLEIYNRKIVLRAIRETIDARRKEILDSNDPEVSIEALSGDIESAIRRLSAYKLKPLINATGIVIHTNLGRSALSDRAINNVTAIAAGYSNLEYEIAKGKRGKRYSHLKDVLIEITGAEDAVVVNNNAAAVLICLDTFARGKEVIVSRGELVEIGGSFRIPDVMESSGAILREVGTTNKTHLMDYENALCGNTAMLLKVHQSNYKIIGFTEEVSIEDLSKLGREFKIPLVADVGSGSIINLEKYGIHGEPTVMDVIKAGADLVTFSGDKLLGGPQAGIIIGKKDLIQKIQKNPMLRAMRIDKMTFAALEATFMQYLDEEKAVRDIPTVRMLTESGEAIKKRANKILSALKKSVSEQARLDVIPDQSRAGGGSLPETDFPTFSVSIKPLNIKLNMLEKRLRLGEPPVIARIKEDSILIDARTIEDREIKTLVNCIAAAINS
ncbi:L-seryl-tRNA(Sec) selenium transferase [bacterium BMS3Bbin09]|nr:L-seryl-tRNA(Sec) selenium transferase [bacterium BMS3Bbin09]HDN94641.1 L-seryl-tRNA(Sec) selenium transferase [Nitrospirota bacterium]